MVIVLAVTGSIAAYKAVEVARLLRKAGANVLPVMSRSAAQFVGASTLSGICAEPVRSDMWDPSYPGELHVDLAAKADVLAIVPATADVLARLASGRADDLVTALALSARGRILVAPAMHPHMWDHPATRENVARLEAHGRVTLVGPVHGEVASGETGLGRMADPAEIARRIVDAASGAAADLAGQHLLVTAGPTVEDLDPVRFLGNRSSGKMGFALAERAAERGARVTLIAGPVALATPRGVRRVDVRSALDMQNAMVNVLGADLRGADVLVMAAAVADYRPATVSPDKLKKDGETTSLELVKNPDLLAEVGRARERTGATLRLVGFAVETGDDAAIERYAAGKLAAKKVDLVVANAAADSFGHDTNRAALVSATTTRWLATMNKLTLADSILDALVARPGAGGA